MNFKKIALVTGLAVGGIVINGNLDTVQATTITIGPGAQTINAYDTAFNLISVDENNPVTLNAGNYLATSFNYQFGNASSTDSFVIPVLLTSSGSNVYTPIAIGNKITYSGATSFISTSFGNSNTFALSSSQVVYAGLYQEFSSGSFQPIGFVDGVGTTFILYEGANQPIIGTPINGGLSGTFSRTYNFSITTTTVPVPESSNILGLGTIVGLGLISGLRRKLSKR